MDEFSDLAGSTGGESQGIGGAPPGAPGALSRALPAPEPGPVRRGPGRPAGARGSAARAPVRKRKKRDYKLEKELREQRRAGGSPAPAGAGAPRQAPALADARAVARQHERIAKLLGDDDWLLTPDEAQEVADAHAEFSRLTGIQLTQKSLGWFGILWTAGTVYGSRLVATMRARVAAKERESRETPASSPPPATGAHTLGAAPLVDIPPPPPAPGQADGLNLGSVLVPGMAPQVYGTIAPIMHPHELDEL